MPHQVVNEYSNISQQIEKARIMRTDDFASKLGISYEAALLIQQTIYKHIDAGDIQIAQEELNNRMKE